jgi:NAD(P)-dependent dehydrogenase (short-subunit alcohol dehydrogenase family)
MTRRTDQQVLDLRDWQPEEADAYARSLIPMERFTSTDEVVDAILMMLEDMPAYINGTVIDMTGGA